MPAAGDLSINNPLREVVRGIFKNNFIGSLLDEPKAHRLRAWAVTEKRKSARVRVIPYGNR
jgi:hypothetical protein